MTGGEKLLTILAIRSAPGDAVLARIGLTLVASMPAATRDAELARIHEALQSAHPGRYAGHGEDAERGEHL